jgi:hypothetical protein
MEFQMRPAMSLFLVSVLFTSSASGAEVTPLTVGKPAGVRQAQMDGDISPLIYFGAVAVGIGIALAVTNDKNAPASAPSTSVSSGTSG